MVPSVPPKLMIYPIGAGAHLDISMDGFVSYRRARYFPDGRRILVSGAEEGKGPRCYVRELANGTVRPVTPEGTEEGRLSPDGLKVIARKVGGGWFTTPVAGGEIEPVEGLDPSEEVIRWSRDGRSLLIHAGRNVSPRIERFDMTNGRRTVVKKLADGHTGVTSAGDLEISSNGRSYAYWFDRSVSVLYAIEGLK